MKNNPESCHCSICGKRSPVGYFEDRMAWLRRHRKKNHPQAARRKRPGLYVDGRRMRDNPLNAKQIYSQLDVYAVNALESARNKRDTAQAHYINLFRGAYQTLKPDEQLAWVEKHQEWMELLQTRSRSEWVGENIEHVMSTFFKSNPGPMSPFELSRRIGRGQRVLQERLLDTLLPEDRNKTGAIEMMLPFGKGMARINPEKLECPICGENHWASRCPELDYDDDELQDNPRSNIQYLASILLESYKKGLLGDAQGQRALNAQAAELAGSMTSAEKNAAYRVYRRLLQEVGGLKQNPRFDSIIPCECSDSGCTAHRGKAYCNKKANTILYRIDMEDETGVSFCNACADDAMESGVFESRD